MINFLKKVTFLRSHKAAKARLSGFVQPRPFLAQSFFFTATLSPRAIFLSPCDFSLPILFLFSYPFHHGRDFQFEVSLDGWRERFTDDISLSFPMYSSFFSQKPLIPYFSSL